MTVVLVPALTSATFAVERPDVAGHSENASCRTSLSRSGLRKNLRIDPDIDRRIRTAAAEQGVSVSQFVAGAAKAAADRTLADRPQFTLDPADWDRFCDLLDRPASDLPGLDAADAAWQKHFGGAARDAA